MVNLGCRCGKQSTSPRRHYPRQRSSQLRKTFRSRTSWHAPSLEQNLLFQYNRTPGTRMFTKTSAFWSFWFHLPCDDLVLVQINSRNITPSIILTMRQKMLIRAITPQYTSVVLWHYHYKNKCYSREAWDALSPEEKAGEISGQKRPRTSAVGL